MARPYTPLVINQFKGEEDSTPSLGETQAASLIQNMYIVNGGLERRLGQSLINTAQSEVTQLQGVSWCRIPDSAPAEYVVGVKFGGFYDYYNAGVAAAPTLLTGGAARLTADTSVAIDMAVVDGKLYAGDGTNAMVRFNGTNVAKAGAPKPASGPTAADSGVAGVINGTVAYRVTYLDVDGNESEASDAGAAVTVASKQVTVTVPNDTDTDRTGKKLYRQGVASTSFLFVASLSASATTYTDNIADANLGAAIATIGQTLFPSCAHVWEHDNRLFGCGNASSPNILYISTEFTPWQCPAAPDLTLPSQGIQLKVQAKNARIIGGISHGAYCFIFTDEGGYILQGTSAEDYRIERFTPFGCTSHRSLQTSRNWLFWVGPSGIYRYDGLNVLRIEVAIQQFFAKASAANLASAVTWYYNDRYYVAFPSDGTGTGIYAGATPGQPGGGVAAVDPSTLGSVNIYLDGRTGMTLSGGNVTQWSDQSGNAQNFIVNLALATAPPQVAGPKAGVNAIQIGTSYDGTHYHAMDNVTLPSYGNASGFTHYIIAKPSASVGDIGCQIFRWTNGLGLRLNYQGANHTDNALVANGHAYLQFSGGASFLDLGLVPTGWVLWTVVEDTANSQIRVYKNAVFVGSSVWTPGNLITELDLGGTDNNPLYEAYLALYLMISATHSPTTVAQSYAWYKANYGV